MYLLILVYYFRNSILIRMLDVLFNVVLFVQSVYQKCLVRVKPMSTKTLMSHTCDKVVCMTCKLKYATYLLINNFHLDMKK